MRPEPKDVIKKWAKAPHDSNIDSTANSTCLSNEIKKKNCHINETMLHAQNTIAKVSRLKRTTDTNLFLSNETETNNIKEVLKNLSSGSLNAKKQKLQKKLFFFFLIN